MENFKFESVTPEINIEQKENKEFTVEEIRQLLKTIDGKERLDLAIKEEIKNIKGELNSLVFTSSEKEVKEGRECRIDYLLTLAGQRYKPDGLLGKYIEQTFLVRSFPDGEFWDEQVADYINKEWTNFSKTGDTEEKPKIGAILDAQQEQELSFNQQVALATKLREAVIGRDFFVQEHGGFDTFAESWQHVGDNRNTYDTLENVVIVTRKEFDEKVHDKKDFVEKLRNAGFGDLADVIASMFEVSKDKENIFSRLFKK